jgi:hypothetical protein
MGMTDLARELEQIQDECDKLAAEKADLEKKKFKIEQDLIKEMTDAGMNSFRDEMLGKSFSIQSDISLKKIDEDAVFAWLKETGNDGAIKETIHAMTLKSIAKKHLEETGTDIPGTEIKMFQKISSRTSSTKSKLNF